ncbi:MAG: hypothetical protein JNK06_17620, partial [Candidatus Accumulibacter phosphatis]|uniref:hypothetical protein n=1 Tax=Candidatus Accumulibacter phosphatis TaxID=327160 RepID=UPI001A56533C|nr:hypothetical protein [Candidatus Accumulibacter phosphatis]
MSLLGLVGGVVFSARSIRQYFKGEETISASDVKTAIEGRKAGAAGLEGSEASSGHLDSKAEGQLTTEAIDIFNLLPPESQSRFGGTALTHDPAESGPFAGTPGFRRWSGQIAGCWRQVRAGCAGGVGSEKRV